MYLSTVANILFLTFKNKFNLTSLKLKYLGNEHNDVNNVSSNDFICVWYVSGPSSVT